MKWCRTISALTILALEVICTNCAQECPKDYYIIVDKNGDKIECLSCARCVVGRGLTPSCGKKLTEAQRANIECIPCKPGETYSDEHGPSSCKRCQICPVTLKNCTAESNTKCSKNCARGQYYDNATYNCQPCSYCCRKDNKRIAECAGQPVQSQLCSVHDSLECSPKTTKNPSSTNNDDDFTSDDKRKKTLDIIIIALGVVGGIILIIVVVFFLKWLLKRRQQRSGGCPPEQVPLANRNNCGITKASFFIMVNPPITSEDEIQEDKNISIICKNQGNAQENCCIDYIYYWKKDMNDYQSSYGEKIEFNPVRVRDFGKYTCQVKCKQHPHQGVNAIELYLDVLPGPNKRYQKFNKINLPEVYENIADMLISAPTGIGDWKRVAEKYEMEPLKVKSLRGDSNRGTEVIDFLHVSQTKLTVYHFCKFMKIIKQNQIVELLEDHLCCELEQERTKVDARDSGYDHDFNGEPSSSSHDSVHCHVPIYQGVGLQKNLGLNDSRQGSSNEKADVRNVKSNRKLDRQISNQSARSSGSGSASNSLKKAVGYVRQFSQNSGYKKHENEAGDPSLGHL